MNNEIALLLEVDMPFEVRKNPGSRLVELECESWARDAGLLAESGGLDTDGVVWSLKRFRAMSVGDAAAWFAPDATLERVTFIGKFIVWTLAWDDYFTVRFKKHQDVQAARAFTDRLHQLIDGNVYDVSRRTPVEDALLYLIRKIESMGPALRLRYLDALHRYVEGGMWELLNIYDRRIPDLVEYIAIRRGTFFAFGILCYIDTATNAEIPDRIRGAECITTLLEAIMDCYTLENDIVSYRYEIQHEDEVSNILVILCQLLHVSTSEATRIVVSMLKRKIELIQDILSVQLPRLVERVRLSPVEKENLEAWLQGACASLAASRAWHSQVLRYSPGVDTEPFSTW
jgi:Terpene synthase family 2, C-terminal metal binding